MANRIIVGLAVLVAIVMALAPDLDTRGILPLALVVLGLAYGAVGVDPEDASGYLILALAVGGAGGADVLQHVPAIGGQLDAIVDHTGTALYSGVVTALAMWIVNRLKG